jgi:uncharacterized protein
VPVDNAARPDLTQDQGAELARRAAQAVADKLRGARADGRPPADAVLCGLGASFVTLQAGGRLRGCIGSLRPVWPLYADVIHNARSAAEDPRLPPVTAADWPDLDVKVAVLGEPEPVPAAGLDELVGQLRPGVHGLILTDDRHLATFLPSVWHKMPDPVDFVRALLAKGGWPDRGWPDGLRVARYTSLDFIDPAPRAPVPPASTQE